MGPTSNQQASQAKARNLIAGVLAVEAVAFTGGITVAPGILEGMVADEDSTGAYLGAFIAIGAFLAFLLSPALGLLSDRYGRRPVLIWSLVFGTIANALMALAPNLLVFFFGRIVSGLAGATIAICYAYATDITAEDKRTGIFGFLGAIFGLGLIAGPALGGILGGWQERAPFWAACILCAASAAIVILRLPESLPVGSRTRSSWKRANPVGSLALLGGRPRLWRGGIVYFMMQSATNLVLVLFVLYTMDRYGWTVLVSGAALAGTGILRAIVQVALVERLSRRFGDSRAMLVGLGFGVVGFATWALAPNGFIFVIGCPFVALLSIASPSLMSIMTRDAPSSGQGELQGALNSVAAIAGIGSPFLFGWLYTYVAMHDPQGPLQGTAFLVGCTVLLVASAITVSLEGKSLDDSQRP